MLDWMMIGAIGLVMGNVQQLLQELLQRFYELLTFGYWSVSADSQAAAVLLWQLYVNGRITVVGWI